MQVLYNHSKGHRLGTFISTLPVPPAVDGVTGLLTRPNPPAPIVGYAGVIQAPGIAVNGPGYRDRVLDRDFYTGVPNAAGGATGDMPRDLFYIPSTTAALETPTVIIPPPQLSNTTPGSDLWQALGTTQSYQQLREEIRDIAQTGVFHVDRFHYDPNAGFNPNYVNIGKFTIISAYYSVFTVAFTISVAFQFRVVIQIYAGISGLLYT